MKRLRFALAGLLLLALAPVARAGNTDLSPEQIQILAQVFCSGLPIQFQPTCILVLIHNAGPDPYVGTDDNKVEVTVDIDEPSEPDGSRKSFPLVFTVTDSFAVNIPAGMSAQVQFSPSGWLPANAGPHTATARVRARGVNIDPNSANNTLVSSFSVFSAAAIPSLGTWGRIALIVGVGGAAWLVWGRRRRWRRT
jgi:hypothetical protein